jgi:hypothetical protein
MKTNQNMIRKMGNFDVVQRTSDGYFNATQLLRQWNQKNPEEQRRLDKFWDSTNLSELMMEIVVNEHITSSPKLGDDNILSSVEFTDDNSPLTFNDLKTLLSRTSKANKGHNAGTFMHPILFINFAMYLSPRFEYHVLKFVADQMIQYRKDAGNEYKNLSAAIKKIVPETELSNVIQHIAKAMNFIVFGKHEKGIRNQHGCEDKQRELSNLEKNVVELIDMKFITRFEDVDLYLRRAYKLKQSKLN